MVKAIIMAGGEGTRLRPLTCNRAKPMIPVINKPVVEHAVELLKKHNITDIVISLFYLPENVQNYFGDGSEWDVNISYSVEENPLGTAGGVRQAAENFTDTFVVLSGDGIIDFDITELIQFHKSRKSPMTIALTRVQEPTEYGIVITERDTGKIEKFLEKPSWSEVFSDTANTGMYVIEPETMKKFVPKDTNFDFSFDLFPLLQSKNINLYGYISDGYWCDVGNIESYLKVHHDILDQLVEIEMPGKRITENVWVGSNVEIDPAAIITGPAVIGDFVKIKKGVEIEEFCVIGNNCVIEEGASLRRSVVLHSTVVGPKAEVRGGIIGKRCFLEENVSIYEQAVVSDDCQIGRSSEIPAGLRVWPDKIIEQGTRLTHDLIWGQTGKKSLFGRSGITGSFNVKVTPEFSAKLGSAIGAYLGRNTRVTISRDASGASRLIKRAITSGLLSMGVDIFDLEIESIPITRFATRFIKTDMSIHVQTKPQTNLQYVVIHLYDKNGFQLLLKAEKKLENIFFRGDYPRKSVFEVGQLHYSTHHLESYMDYIGRYVDIENLTSAALPLIVDGSNGAASYIFPDLLSYCGCRLTTLRGQVQYVDKESNYTKDDKKARKQIVTMTSSNREIGVLISRNGDTITVFDEEGNELLEDHLVMILSLYFSKYKKVKKINLPVTVSRHVDSYIKKFKSTVNRISTKLRAPQNSNEVFAESESGVYPTLMLNYDVMVSFLLILEYIVREEKTLSAIRKELPESGVIHTNLECGQQEKASIMRELIENPSGDEVELKDGVRIIRPTSWILILPDASQPLIHIHAEADSDSERDAIVAEFSRKIKNIRNKAKINV
jgi:mannose-1-phosphate guanylyltransferase/phosphomannomutase